jgi:non-ribosomal peptide synthetase component F
MLASPKGEQLWSYWKEKLVGHSPVLNLPTDHPRPPAQTSRGASHSFKLDSELTHQLKSLTRSEETTLYTTLLAAFELLLYRYSGQEDFLVGTPTNGRSRHETAGVVGYFVNPVVMRADISLGLTFNEYLARVRQTVLGAFAHQDYPLALLVERLQPERDASRSPLFQVMFALQKAHLLDKEGLAPFALGEAGGRLKLGELELESLALEQRIAQVDLTLTMAEVDGGLAAAFEYNTDLFEPATVRRIAQNFHTLLKSIVAAPDAQASVLPILTEAERHLLLVERNRTEAAFPHGQCIHELLETQVERTPEAIAVVNETQETTYGELNRRANQLAHNLKSLGVRRAIGGDAGGPFRDTQSRRSIRSSRSNVSKRTPVLHAGRCGDSNSVNAGETQREARGAEGASDLPGHRVGFH